LRLGAGQGQGEVGGGAAGQQKKPPPLSRARCQQIDAKNAAGICFAAAAGWPIGWGDWRVERVTHQGLRGSREIVDNAEKMEIETEDYLLFVCWGLAHRPADALMEDLNERIKHKLIFYHPAPNASAAGKQARRRQRHGRLDGDRFDGDTRGASIPKTPGASSGAVG